MQKDLTKTQRLAIAAMLSERQRIEDQHTDITMAMSEHVKMYAKALGMPEDSKLSIGPEEAFLVYEEEEEDAEE